ncbi:MAG: aldehyde dehydrogenase family protein [Bacteriovoracaceae bacterium]|nr:aldehyde dehydrogenase family protein [Bacteriovoracaceae bacterium]
MNPKFDLKGNYFENSFYLGHESSFQRITKYSPANTKDLLWECIVDPHHVDKVMHSAETGFNLWKKTPLSTRISYLKKYQERVSQRREEVALAIALETGKPLWEAHTEVNSVIAKIDITISDSLELIADKKYEKILPETNGLVHYKPLGISLIIGPFNFPCHLANGQILSALIAGNSIIYKPSEKTIYSAQLLIECFHQAEFPLGVINFINGGGDIVSDFLKEKSVRGVFFTGSKEVGEKILEKTYKDFSKLVALEMGGKNTTIIHADALTEPCLYELLKSCFLTTGQRCTATSKVAIHSSLKNEFIEKFHALAKKIIIDHPTQFDIEPFMGPLIDHKSMDNYLLYMGMAKREGAEEIMRGKHLEKKFEGYYVSPSIHVMEKRENKSTFLASEIFGPNCTFIPYNDIEEAIQIANMGEYGLAGSVFTKDESIYQKCLENIDVGLLNWNRSTVGASAKLPFGGVKSSGNYRPAGSFMISSCAYPVASLQISAPIETIDKPKGLIE